jgi:hypothetical protein
MMILSNIQMSNRSKVVLLNRSTLLSFSSFKKKQKKNRGQGLGKALVAEILVNAAPDKTVFLLTVRARRKFYETCGFQDVSSLTATTFSNRTRIPLPLKIEKLIGSPIAHFAAQDSLIIMEYSPHN